MARDILDYVARDLTHAQGGFFSAEDADSLEGGEKKEGAFYVWTQEEVRAPHGLPCHTLPLLWCFVRAETAHFWCYAAALSRVPN